MLPTRAFIAPIGRVGTLKSQRSKKICLFSLVLATAWTTAISSSCLILLRVTKYFYTMTEHLILTAIPWVNYYFHFTDKETEAQRLVMSWQRAVSGGWGQQVGAREEPCEIAVSGRQLA